MTPTSFPLADASAIVNTIESQSTKLLHIIIFKIEKAKTRRQESESPILCCHVIESIFKLTPTV